VTKLDPAFFVLAAIHALALLALWPAFFSWSAILVALGLYAATELAITLGYHRLLTHRSYAVPQFVEYALAGTAALAFQHGPIEWVAQHRAHHAHADADGDPHNARRSLRWAHVAWIFLPNESRVRAPQRRRLAADLIVDPFYRFLDKGHLLLIAALALALFALGGWPWVIWGIFVRLVFTYHCTWLVSSAAHSAGYRTFATSDLSTNNWWVAALTFGEGWHNNHHAFPFSARHGLRWFEFDPTFWLIALMARLGIARDVRLPTRAMIERRIG
jgi:sn-1 stearoyl-lipid 9-desaturase